MMSIPSRRSRRQGPKPLKKPKTRKTDTHFTIDGEHRYCTGWPRGKDELADSWIRVDCHRCLEKRELELHPEMLEKLLRKLREE